MLCLNNSQIAGEIFIYILHRPVISVNCKLVNAVKLLLLYTFSQFFFSFSQLNMLLSWFGYTKQNLSDKFSHFPILLFQAPRLHMSRHLSL